MAGETSVASVGVAKPELDDRSCLFRNSVECVSSGYDRHPWVTLETVVSIEILEEFSGVKLDCKDRGFVIDEGEWWDDGPVINCIMLTYHTIDRLS